MSVSGRNAQRFWENDVKYTISKLHGMTLFYSDSVETDTCGISQSGSMVVTLGPGFSESSSARIGIELNGIHQPLTVT